MSTRSTPTDDDQPPSPEQQAPTPDQGAALRHHDRAHADPSDNGRAASEPSTTTTAVAPAAPAAPASISLRAARPLRWWREVVYIVLVYGVYSSIRNLFGSAGGPTGQANAIAYGHAKVVIEIERAVGLFVEQRLQNWYLDLPLNGWIEFWNVYYGSFHFVVTAAALVLLFRRQKHRYPVWRNTLAFTTLLALVGFASFALMPPRLLDEPQAAYGPPATAEPHHDGFVDTLAEYGTLWSFDSGTLKEISNQYAAMPSLHIGWSLWCLAVLLPMVRRRWAKALVIAYPIATFFCIVVTANHYWLDAAGGAAVFGTAFLLARAVTAFWDRRRPRSA